MAMLTAYSAEPAMRVWAYVFLARIFDLECNRERAVEYYQQATKVGDNTRNAQAAARDRQAFAQRHLWLLSSAQRLVERADAPAHHRSEIVAGAASRDAPDALGETARRRRGE